MNLKKNHYSRRALALLLTLVMLLGLVPTALAAEAAAPDGTCLLYTSPSPRD